MKKLTVSKWSAIWGLAWQCIVMIRCESTEDLGNGLINFECEMLPVENCAYAVGTGGFRCMVETALNLDGSIKYECQTLRLAVQLGENANPSSRSPYIETDECINACGLQRLTVGISTDDILYDNSFREKLCSPTCKQKCANIIDHYDTIMAEEGEDLSGVCQNLMEYLRTQRNREKQSANRTAARESESKRKSKLSSQVIRKQDSGWSRQRENSARYSISNKQELQHEQQAPGPRVIGDHSL